MSHVKSIDIIENFKLVLQQDFGRDAPVGVESKAKAESYNISRMLLSCLDKLSSKDNDIDELEIGVAYLNEIYEKVRSLSSAETEKASKMGFILGFCDVYARELVINKGPFDEEIKEVFVLISTMNKNDSILRTPASEAFNKVAMEYHKIYGPAINRERMETRVSHSVNNLFVEKFDNIYEKSKDINEKLTSCSNDLKDLQSGIAVSALLKDLAEFSTKIGSKITKLESQGRLLKLAMFITPIVVMSIAIFAEPHWQYYSSFAVVMILLGVLLKNNLRSLDQFEQISSKIDNKIAMTMYHRNQMEMYNEEDQRAANVEFMRMIYSPIETREWNSPDLSEQLISAVKRVR